MKNLITFLLYCLSVTALLAQARSETRLRVTAQNGFAETTLQFSLSGTAPITVQTPRGEASVVCIGDGTPLLRKGAPDVPKYAAALQIPNHGAMAVEVLESAYEEFFQVEIAPSKGNLSRNVDPASVPFEYGPAYEQDRFFPGTLAELQTPFIFRQSRGQPLWIYPVQYNPRKKILRVYHSITLRVRPAAGASGNELAGGPVQFESRAFADLQQRLFVNADTRVQERGGGGQTPDKMLVIAPDNLLPELQPLLDWKRQSGIHTTVAPLSEIGSPKAAEIYNFVKKYYEQHGITYLLLVGDEHTLEAPLRPDGGEEYACDNCFGYLAGDDHYPEVLVGRLHAATPAQLRIMVNRNLEYEKHPLIDLQQNWAATGLALASDEGAGIGDDGQADWQQANEWKSAHLAHAYEQYWEFYDGSHGPDSPTPGSPTADADGNPSASPVVDLLNSRGASLLNYTGHGWMQGLSSGNFNTGAVANLHNAQRYPILIAVACSAGDFTHGECLGEAWQRAGDAATGTPWGGIAGFFSSDLQTWSPPMEGQDGMNQYLTEAPRPALGGLLAYGNAKMITAYGPAGEQMADFWNAFAEPSTMPRTRTPQPLSATHPQEIPFESTELLVSCPSEGALVSLFWESQTWAVATVENGVASLQFPNLNNTGTLTVTVTQFNHIPYQNQITVKPPAGAFVTLQNAALDDSDGNQNQQADFGETLKLSLSIRNAGLGEASGVKVQLAVQNPYVTLIDTLRLPGTLKSEEHVAVPFVLQVHDDVPDGTPADFALTLTCDGAPVFYKTITVTLRAPALCTGAWTLDDSNGGNGNQHLESGETALLRIRVRNGGHSSSPPAVATLFSDSPYLTTSGAVALGILPAGAGEQEVAFTLGVAPNTPQNYLASLHFAVSADAYAAQADGAPLVLNPVVESFESGNFGAYNWKMSGNKPWVLTTTGAYDGAYCARSGVITHLQKSALQLSVSVQEAGVIGFARRVSSEAGYDFLRFYIDGAEAGAWSGEQPWAEMWYPVTPGMHTFAWIYEKDDLRSEGSDRAWVDEITLPPHQIVVGTPAPPAGDFQVNVVPNPAREVFALQLNLTEAQTFGAELYDAAGRRVRVLFPPEHWPAGGWSRTFGVEDLPNGVYFVRVRSDRGQDVVKIVVQ